MANLKERQIIAALASATSANGTTRNGAIIPLYGVQPGTLCVRLKATLVTASVVATAQLQVSDDQVNWYNLQESNNPAQVSTSGTGTFPLALSAPNGAHGWRFFRCQVTLSGASTASGDLTEMDYRYRPYWR